jgi:hypothetical protein
MANPLKNLVGVAGFEPATPTSRTSALHVNTSAYVDIGAIWFAACSRFARVVFQREAHMNRRALRMECAA